jgi:tetratricopeptide (TPR) repeat protein/CHAT domain-containing protein
MVIARMSWIIAAAIIIWISSAIVSTAAAPRDEAAALQTKVEELYDAGKYADAIPLAQRALAIREKALGPDHPDVATSLYNLANLYHSQGRYAEAEPLYQRSLAIREKALGRDHLDVAASLNNLALLYHRQGRYADAEPLYQRSLAIKEKARRRDDPDIALSLNNLANLYHSQGRYADAEPLYRRSLAINEKALGRDHPDVAYPLDNLASLYKTQGRYADAEPLFKRSLAIREKALSRDHPVVAQSLNSLALLYEGQGRYADAEPLFKRSLAIREKALGRDHPDVASSLNNLATLYGIQGRYADAEPLYQRSLAINEKALGRDHREVATSLNNLAALYRDQGRYADAEPLYQRSLAIDEKALGPDHPDVALSLNNLAYLYNEQGRYADAEPLYQRSLAIREKALGPNHPYGAQSLNNLADLYRNQGRYADAEPLSLRSVAIREKALGRDHPDVALSLNNLAALYRDQRRYADAEPLFKRLLAVREKALGRDHPDVAVSMNNLAELYRNQDRYADALPLVEGVIVNGRASPEVALPVLIGAQQNKLISAETALDDGLNVAQRASQSSAAAAVNKLAVRLSAGSGRLSQLIRRDQDLAAEAEALDKTIIAAVAKEPARRDSAAEQRIRDRLAAIAAERNDLQQTFAKEFPDYAALSNPLPLTGKEVQALLSADEALVLFFAGGKENYVFALTREGFDWKAIPVGGKALAEKVAAFRRGLDVDALHRGLGRVDCTQAEADKRGLSRIECGQALAKECEEAEKRGLARTDCATAQDRRGLFDLGLAHELYETLIGPVEPPIRDKKHLIVVPSGALTALPFHLLVTEKPATAVPQVNSPRDLAAYRDAAWLIKRHTVSVLPSVASLKASRAFAPKDVAGKPMVGFGDPLFDPSAPAANTRVASNGARNLTTRSYTEFFAGAGVDRTKLAQALPPLPDTADELKAVAKDLGAPEIDIHLGRDASETTVKRLRLADYRVVYFATHGLVAGDIKGLAEPSLALTLPKQPSDLDDGLLTASEVAQLKLNADWVVLSACNTIAGDKPGAEALSGLARAFFYAGARALLVSHWSVESNAAMRLTTSTFDILKSDPKLGRAEALRRAMLAYMNDTTNPLNAYPALWAPFVVVGEGAAR